MTLLKKFPIGIFYQPAPAKTTYEAYKDIKDMHVNFIVGTNGVSDKATNKAALVQIEANQLKLLVADEPAFRELPDDDELDTIMQHYQHEPAVIGYHVYDEPTVQEMDKLSRISQRIKVNDPNKLAFINLFPIYARHHELLGLRDESGTVLKNGEPVEDLWMTPTKEVLAEAYEDYVERWMRTKPELLVFDYYPFKVENGFSDRYYENMEIIRRQALAGNVDFWTYIQSVGIKNWLRSPSLGDLRYHIYTNLAYGAKGYIYFTYETPYGSGYLDNFFGGIILQDGSKSPSYEWSKEINAEVLQLGPTLLSLTSVAVYHTGELAKGTTALPDDFILQPEDLQEPLVIGVFANESGRQYVMIVNRDWEHSRKVIFHLDPSIASVKEVSKETGEEVDVAVQENTGKLTIEFTAGDGKLYALN